MKKGSAVNTMNLKCGLRASAVQKKKGGRGNLGRRRKAKEGKEGGRGPLRNTEEERYRSEREVGRGALQRAAMEERKPNSQQVRVLQRLHRIPARAKIMN